MLSLMFSTFQTDYVCTLHTDVEVPPPQLQTVPNHYLWLYKDKTLLYMVKLTAKLSCGMDFTDYPHDTQVCSLRVISAMISVILQVCFIMIESLSHTTEDLIFKWNFTEPLFINPEIKWEIVN